MGVQERIKPAYANKAKIRNLVETARELGLDVAGIEVSPDGSIRVVEARAIPRPTSLFDQLEDQL
ncbi:hypothetical protein DFR49_3394 [Hephaestia caeni]|uniref:Uncharacterized protein n=1 Tax=Hephaestia caeni TaxID=645617 RepID=A0A397NPB1_9SPHN|nr:hypothetical protein [Hephaestia caeni]RIA37509.1 hypothetical protein DFR49_3394 [Hephaestia caeni]